MYYYYYYYYYIIFAINKILIMSDKYVIIK